MTLSIGSNAGQSGQSGETKKESVTYRIYEDILEDIRSGKLSPGMKLKVRELSEAYQGSVGSCREVMNRLAGERFVESRGMTGFKVRRLSAAEFTEIHDLRDALEAHALRAAISIGGHDWEESIILAYHRLTRSKTVMKSTIVDRENLHREFHLSLIAAGSSEWHQFYVRMLNLHGERYRRILLPDRILNNEYLTMVEAEHGKLMQLCLDRKANEAVKLLKQHRSRSKNDLLDALNQLEK